MSRYHLLAACLLLALSSSPRAQFFNPAFVPPGGAGGGSCTTSQWDAANKGADVTLGGSPCKLTVSGGDATNDEIVRGTTSKSGTTTSYEVEFTLNTVLTTENLGVGVSDALAPLGPTGDPYCGSTQTVSGTDHDHSICYYPFLGKVYRAGATIATIFTATSGDVIRMRVDMSAACSGSSWSVSFNKNGGAFSDMGIGSLPHSSSDTLFVTANVRNNDSTATVNFKPSAPSACASTWDP